jgi:hypothetical protein
MIELPNLMGTLSSMSRGEDISILLTGSLPESINLFVAERIGGKEPPPAVR